MLFLLIWAIFLKLHRNFYCKNGRFLSNFSFEKIWLYANFPEIGQEWRTPSLTRQEYSSKANSGSNNAGAKVTVEDVIEIRKRYDNGEAVRKIWEDYQIITVESVRKICKR